MWCKQNFSGKTNLKIITLFPLKFKGASSRSTNAQKLKGEENMPRMNEKTSKFTVK